MKLMESQTDYKDRQYVTSLKTRRSESTTARRLDRIAAEAYSTDFAPDLTDHTNEPLIAIISWAIAEEDEKS